MGGVPGVSRRIHQRLAGAELSVGREQRASEDHAECGYCGVPGVLVYRPDLSLVALFAIDIGFDYLNPTMWTGRTNFDFENHKQPPQYCIGGGKLSAGVKYRMPLQLLLSDGGDSVKAITALMRAWIAMNDYRVEPLKVRSYQEGFDLFLQGRTRGKMWKEGLGYQIMQNWRVVYTAESPINAWFDYLLYEQTGDAVWRRRAFAAMDLVLKAQHTDPRDPHFGAIETNYELDKKVFNSKDHSPNWHYKVDMHWFRRPLHAATLAAGEGEGRHRP